MVNLRNVKMIPALHLASAHKVTARNLYVERYDDKEFYRVRSIVHDEVNKSMLFLDTNDYPILELFDVDKDTYVATYNVATHATEENMYFNPEQFDSCADRWFFIKLGE